MRTSILISFLILGVVDSFLLPTSDAGVISALHMSYIPDGFTKESYARFKEQERQKAAKKNLGGVGPKGFKSRSMQSFQEALERGEAAHLLPVFNAKEKIAKGELKLEDIPYMQRGGAWDNSDVKGAKKVKWLKSDVEYANGGYQKGQSVSIFGVGQGLDWTGNRGVSGPQQTKAGSTEKKKFFGLF
mmetsp:Transcript_13927/g.19938  ORF Transcript_13927/g.19938 Transcript_13927/m.19938 type:complete len:187 (-) Transcript_13927:631-1191(-)